MLLYQHDSSTSLHTSFDKMSLTVAIQTQRDLVVLIVLSSRKAKVTAVCTVHQTLLPSFLPATSSSCSPLAFLCPAGADLCRSDLCTSDTLAGNGLSEALKLKESAAATQLPLSVDDCTGLFIRSDTRIMVYNGHRKISLVLAGR